MPRRRGWRDSLRRFGRDVLRSDVDVSARLLRQFADPLEQRLLLATDLSPALITSIKNNYNTIFNTVDAVHDRIFNNVLARSLPLVGQALNVLDQPADLLNRISNDIRNEVGELVPLSEFSSDDLQQKLFDANLPGISNVSQIQKFLNSNNEVEYLVPLSGTLVNLSSNPAFNATLPGLGLSVTDGTVNVDLTYTFNLKLGFNTTDLVYIDLGATNEVQLHLVVTTPGLTLQGNLGFLKMTATNTDLPFNPADRRTKPTTFDGTFGLDFTDGPDAGTKLTLGEIGSLGIAPNLTGSTDINLKLNVDFGSGQFPSFEAYMNVGWDFSNSPASVSTPASSFGGVPMVSFNNVSVDLGSFLSKFASPVVTQINKVLKPVRPIMDKLYEDIPSLTTINRYIIRPPGPQLDVNGDNKVTIRDLLEFQSGTNLRFLDQFQTFLDIFPDVPDFNGVYKVPLGSFDLTQNQLNGGGTIDVRTLANLANVNLSNFTVSNAVQAIKDFANNNGLGDVFDFINDIGSEVLKKQTGDVGEGLKFPIIEQPESALTLFLGQNPILFYFDMNPIVYDLPLLISIRPPAFPFVSAGLRGSLGNNHALKFRAKFAFGYDTAGLTSFLANPGQPGRLLDGFYISDRANPDGTGADDAEVKLDLGVELFGSAGVPAVADLVLGGGPQANISVNLKDPDNDGRVRFAELATGFSNGPLCAFDISGILKTVFRLVLETPIKDIELSSSEYTLLSFTLDCGIGDNEPILATYDQNTETLYLNMGPRAGDRVHGDLTDGDEKFYVNQVTVLPDGSEVLEVTAFGLTQTYGGPTSGIRHVVAYGGEGHDDIALANNVTSSANLWGDFDPVLHPGMTQFGNDHLASGIGGGTLRGGSGDDELLARVGFVTLLGESGNDRLFGSPGADTIDGGSGNDTVFGNEGNDSLSGGADHDQLYGFDGDDTLDGGTGNDTIFGELGNDTLIGADGSDQLLGFDGNDSLDGGIGEDILEGEAGADTLNGGANNDTLIGGGGDDNIIAGGGNDIAAGDDATVNIPVGTGISLTGGSGNDSIVGDAGTDLIYGQGGNDTLRGGTDNDTIYGSDGDDHLFGDDNDDHILAELGDDSVEGGAGNDSILGSSGLDTIHGQDGLDTISGGTNSDLIFGNADADSIAGDSGDDSIEAGVGNDTLTGDDGNDTIHGQDDADQISGGNNDDFITGGLGNDAIDGNAGNDSIQGNAGDDTISGLAGKDSIRGDAGNDSISGGSEDDFVRAGAGNDSVDGSEGNDILHGDDGDDSITGNLGADRIDGGIGNDTIYGFAAAGTDDNAADTFVAREGNDSIIAGGGADFIDAGAGTDTVTAGDGDDTILAGSGIGDAINAGMGHDFIVGSDEGSDSDPNFADAVYFGDIIDAGAGDDTVAALGGADLIIGGTGNDWIDSGAGGDSVSGGDNHDFIYAGQNGVTGDSISGLAGSDTIWGSEANDTLSGGDDNDSILAQDGSDSVTGDGGDDVIDAGAGNNDFASGGSGNDEIADSGGVGNTLHGDSGNDTLTGSNDGSDSILGGSERDRISGRAGNDTLLGGSHADTIHGGEGDDLISGEAGADLLVGGQNHDTIYGHSSSGAGDDNAQDTLYGDLGTNGNEPNSGRDQLLGQGGNDFHYGEGDLDSITGGGGGGNLISYGPGGSTTPEAYGAPGATPPPTIQPPPPALTFAGSTLPAGADDRGRWTELASSASNNGVSDSGATAIEPSIAIAPDGSKYVAWADARRGNHEIYIARYTAGSGWQQLAGSASEGGVSNTLTSSRRPSITIGGDGNPIVAWTETNGTNSDIRVARFDGADWAALGTSLGTGGISNTGTADRAIVLNSAGGTIVTWLNGSNVYGRIFSAGTWQEFGSIGTASGTGISANPSGIFDYHAATDGTKLAVTWSANDSGGVGQIYLREFNGTTWNALGTSFSGSGLSSTTGESNAPSVAYYTGQPFVSWHDNTSGLNEIHTARFNGAAWVSAGTTSTHGDATASHLASSAGGVSLIWNDDTAVSGQGAGVSLYAMKWNGSTFVPDLATDNSGPGIHPTHGLADVAIAVSATGRPTIAWDDAAITTKQILLRANDFTITSIFNAGNGTSVQSILDNNALGSGDVILVTGSSAGFAVTAADAGVSIIGAPGATISGAVTVDGAHVTIEGLSISGTLSVNAATFTVRDSALAGVQISGAADAQLVHNTAGVITLSGGASGSVIEHNAAVTGITLGSGGATNLTIRENMINGTLSLANASSGTISQNRINAGGTGLSITAAFTGDIADNDITGGSIGVLYSAAGTLSGNRIFGSGTGVNSTVSGGSGFGFVGTSEPNHIYGNTIGVSLSSGSMQNQHVYSNTTGVSGSGSLGPSTRDLANLIELNTTGVNFSGIIRYNKIARNVVGILANSNQLISHNIIWNNTQYGVRVMNKTNVRLFNNTLYTNSGDNVRLDTASSDVQIINNILFSEGGYNINVAADSRTGFFSDYNLLHSAGSGKLVNWLKDFTDLLDWQSDVAEFDLHSIGTTVLQPDRSDPGFINPYWDNFETRGLIGGQRNSAVSIDAGTSIADQGADITRTNLLTNPSFESGVTNWTTNAGGATQSSNPNPWEGSSYFYPGSVALGFAEQTINLSTAGYSNVQLDAQDLVLTFGGRVRSMGESMQIVLTFQDGSNATISSVSLQARNVGDRWELLGDRRAIPVGTRSVEFRLESNRQSGTTNDSYLDSAFVYVESENNAPDLGAFGHTSADAPQIAPPHLAVRNPDLYTDLILTQPIDIQWDSFGNSGDSSVRIDLYQDTVDGPEFLLNIAPGTPDTGHFTWIPQSSGLAAGTSGLRVQVSLTSDNISIDRGTEPSTVPQAGSDYYVDDPSNTNDEYTPAAIGSNRNTGKLATAPKPLLTTLARIYDLDPAQTVHIDTGTYQHFKTLTISGVTTIGNDEGVTITGPNDPGKIAQISPLGFTSGAMIDINSGDFTTITRLTLTGGTQYGIWLRNASTNNTLSYITQSGAILDGIRAETDSTPQTLHHLDISSNGQSGVYLNSTQFTPSGGVSDSRFYNNTQYGLYVGNALPSTMIEGNEAFGNRYGIAVITFAPSGTPVIIGNSDLAISRGNTVYNNSQIGIYAQGAISVAGNTVYGQNLPNAHGIEMVSGAVATKNVVHGNTIGIYGGGATFNRVYNNTTYGVQTFDNVGLISGNVIYSNGVGVFGQHGFGNGPNFQNNLVYANATRGLWMSGGRNATIYNNTFYQPSGDAIVLDAGGSSSDNNRFVNNIIHVGSASGYGIRVAQAVQPAVISDFNLLYTTNGAKVGLWQGADRTTLGAWRSASFQDASSISGDPLYVDFDGADNLLGFTGGADAGSDDNFHEKSPDGSFKGASLAPIISGVTGLPVDQSGSYSNDAGVASPIIDRGDGTFPFVNEPVNNGAFINIGAYGNTNQASRSPAQYTLVMRPNGGETAVRGQNFTINWRQENLGSSNVMIELLHSPGLALETTIAASAPNTGSFVWAVPSGITIASDYVVRITRIDIPAISDVSDATFAIADATPIYYVNDDTFGPGDWTTAPGNDANDGLTPTTPKASVQAMLAAYDFGPGDIIRIDRGIYNLTTDISIGNDDSGVTIVGFTNSDQSGQWPTSMLGDSPTHYFRLGESSGTAANDSSGNNNHATYENGVMLGGAGALQLDSNTAATFDGVDDRVRLPSGFNSFPSGFSFEAWVFPTSISGTQSLFDLGVAQASNNIVLFRQFNSTSLTFQVYNGGSGGTSVTATNALLLNEWQHIAVTMTGAGAARIYRNGLLLASGNVNVPSNINRTNNFLGSDNWAANARFAGRMDEAAFYSTTLSAEQITARYSLAGDLGTTINRGNTSLPAFALTNTDNVTISDLRIIGASTGVRAASGSDSDGVTLSGSEIYGTASYGIEVLGSNDNWTISGNTVHATASRAIAFSGSGSTLTGNRVSSSASHGIEIGNPNTVSGNTVFSNTATGIIATFNNSGNTSLPKLIVEDNQVFANGWKGIELYGGWAVARENTVYAHTAGAAGDFHVGIYAAAGEVSDNTIHGNRGGVTGNGLYTGNRIYNNTVLGMAVGLGGTAERNIVYNNGTYGIYAVGITNAATRGPWLRNNLVYASGSYGIFVDAGTDTEVWNNTVYSTAGDGIALGTPSVNTSILNNIVVVNSGIGLNYGTNAHSNLSSDYNLVHLTGAGNFGRLGGQTYPTKADFFFDTGFDHYTQTADPQLADPDGADNLLGYSGGVDHGADDDFSLLSTGPGIDAGHPSSHYLQEPLPNGARVNLGHQGNSAFATTSPAKSVSVLSPDGLEKLTVGQLFPIGFTTAGLAQMVPVLTMNAGGTAVGPWGATAFLNSLGSNASIPNTIDTSLVTNPAPQQVYRQYLIGSFSTPLSLKFPVLDGTYSMRLHFMEPTLTGAGQRKIDVSLNGALMTDDYDPFAAAGNMRFKATTLSYNNVSASGGSGISLNLTPFNSNAAIISAVEITAATPSGSANPKVNIDVSLNNGSSWSPVAMDVPIDAWGRGSFDWTPDTASSQALIRVSDVGSPASDTSNEAFIISASGQDYYINDNSTAGDFFTTAVGSDLNSGKTPADPMRSLSALLAAYSFAPGDVIHMDSGTYVLSATVTFVDSDSNVTIEGPPAGMGTVLINRNNTSSPAIRFDGADGVTLRRLSITGGNYGVYSEFNSNFPTAISNNITIDDCDIYSNTNYGVYFFSNAHGSLITNSRIRDNAFADINFGSMTGLTISNNKLYNSARGAQGSGSGVVVTGNEAYNTTQQGLAVSGSNASTLASIEGNLVRNNTGDGILASFADVFDNTVFGNTVFAGIRGTSSTVRGNLAYGNATGIVSISSTASENRAYNNTVGIEVNSGTAWGNAVYNNVLGMLGTGAFTAPIIRNNLVYSNTTSGVRIVGAYAPQILSNTIYQPTGDGIRIEGGIGNVTKAIKSNIIQVNGGYGIWVDHNLIQEVSSDYNTVFTTGSGKFGRAGSADFTTREQWFYETRHDRHSLTAEPQFIDIDGADNLLGYSGGGDHGLDDNFSVQLTSPTIDAGDPAKFVLAEPSPNGGRVNQGHTGDTADAATSSIQIIQLTSPNSFEKLEAGSSHTIIWRSDGLTTDRTIALLNLSTRPNGSGLGDWQQGDSYGVVVPNSSWTSGVINTSAVISPGPQDMYQTYTYANNGVGNLLSYKLPLADGAYTLRFHWAEPSVTSVGARLFDIKINGVVVQTDYDIYAVAGNERFKAVALSIPVSAASGEGVLLELVNKTSNPAFLCGMEITAANPVGFSSPTATLEYSSNAGGAWTTIATGLPINANGIGSHNWAVPATISDQVLVRVTAEQGSQPSDVSNALLQIVNNGTDYYVNDASLTGDTITTAIGSNANHGKSAEKPMSSIFALLYDYNLEPGDVVHVDAGTYSLIRNITLIPDDSGVTIQGPQGAAVASINRGNQAQYSDVFQFLGADNVTLDRLTMLNAYNGVEFGQFSATGDSDNNTISNSDISQFSQYGIYMLIAGDDNNTFSGNKVHDGTHYGIHAAGAGTNISGNEVFNIGGVGTGIAITAANSVITGNTVFGNVIGILMTNNNPVVSGNIVRNNTSVGISSANLVNALISGNEVFANPTGIASTSTPVIGNRVYANTTYGIDATNAEVRGNQIYSNATGLRFSGANPSSGYSNLIYANTTRGILVENSSVGVRLWNNTVYSIVGDAIRLTNSSNVSIFNNILWTNAGSAIFVNDSTSQTGLASDRNLFNGTGSVGSWGGVVRTTLGDWQGASGKDNASLSGDPLFVDLDGADNVLGYRTNPTPLDGGEDDNFFVAKISPAIDRGHSWNAAHVDFDSGLRVDDPGTTNSGSSDYFITNTGSSQFTPTGTAKNWRSGNTYFGPQALGFSFPFFGTNYTQVYVGTNGMLHLGSAPGVGSPLFDTNNSLARFVNGGPLIAPLWDALNTFANAADDIFVDTSSPNQITIRWNATHVPSGGDVQFAVVLFSDGSIRFDYGPGNANLSPTIGIASGNGQAYQLTAYDAQATLTNATSLSFNLAAGITDIGALEFRGTSADATPPTVTSSNPSIVHSGGSDPIGPSQILLNFNEALNRIDAAAPANYDLRAAGTDNNFDTGDDIIYTLAPQYVDGTTLVTLGLGAPLPNGNYRLTLRSNPSDNTGLHDRAGILLDGDSNTSAGGNYVRIFSIAADTTAPAVLGTPLFNVNAPQQSITVQFSENVLSSLSSADLEITNSLTPGSPIPAGNIQLQNYDTNTHTATFIFSGFLNNAIPDGNYSARFIATGIRDSASNPLSTDVVFSFYFLNGDATRDRIVDTQDFNMFAGNFGMTGRNFSQSNFNYDNIVDSLDFNVFVAQYGKTLAAPSATPFSTDEIEPFEEIIQ